MNYIKFMRGTPELFSALPKKDPDTLYFIYQNDEVVGQLWIGDRLITSSTSADKILSYLNELNDVDTSGAKQGMYLGYNNLTKSWIPMSLPQVIKESVMIGATESMDGQQGLVPVPKANDNNKFLRGDGTWVKIDIDKVIDSVDKDEFEILEKNDTKILNLKTIPAAKIVNLTSNTAFSILKADVADLKTVTENIEDRTVTLEKKVETLQANGNWGII